MIARNLAGALRAAARQYPVVTLTGPRQSGKTTLCRATFPDRPYVSLEPLDNRAYAGEDPRGFLAEHADGAVIDEVQHVPTLLSYLQAEVDARPDPGRFILTGSQHLGLAAGVAQSLAGRTAILHLLPLSLDELRRFPRAPTDLLTTLWTGAYPRIHDRGIPAARWLADYVATYVQRDVRTVLNVGDLLTFTTFIKLCAGRTAQEVNLTALGSDAGVSHVTARAWSSVLEAGFIVFRLPAWPLNARKQLVKAPRLHLFDSGLACHLLGIAGPEQLRHHPLRGAIFESWVASEIFKARANRGQEAHLAHFRESRGLEIDLIVERGEELIATEVKSGATVAGDWFDPLGRFAALLAASQERRRVVSRLVYGGDTAHRRGGVAVIPWHEVPAQRWTD
ncbi:MAG TPA: ATP-binding protein [Polyangia bacterium]